MVGMGRCVFFEEADGWWKIFRFLGLVKRNPGTSPVEVGSLSTIIYEGFIHTNNMWSHILWIAIAIIRKIHWWGFRLHCPENTTKQPPGPVFGCGPWDFFPHGCNPQAVASHSGSLPGGDLLDVSATAPWVERFLSYFHTRIGSGVPMKSRFCQRHFKMCFIFGVGGGYYMRCTAIRCNFEVFYLFLN